MLVAGLRYLKLKVCVLEDLLFSCISWRIISISWKGHPFLPTDHILMLCSRNGPHREERKLRFKSRTNSIVFSSTTSSHLRYAVEISILSS
jgi:hypothetical protein